MIRNIYFLFALCFLFLTACSKDDDNDMEMPEIKTGVESQPTNCQTFQKGSVITFIYTFSDNKALGSYNIEIHNNFGHHSHSTESSDCNWDEEKTPVNPWVFNQSFPIPENLTRYETNIDIEIPTDIDSGDYHFMVRLTDKAGWQQIKAVSIKISDNSLESNEN